MAITVNTNDQVNVSVSVNGGAPISYTTNATSVSVSQPSVINVEVTSKGPKGDPGDGGGGSGSALIGAEINITNPDDAFEHMTTPITTGTSIEEVLRDMLEKYTRTTIRWQSLRYQQELSDGSFSSDINTNQFSTSDINLEVGRSIKLIGFDYIIGDNSQTVNNSVELYNSGALIEGGLPDNNEFQTLSTPEELVFSTFTTRTLEIRATDDGGISLPDQVISTSFDISIKWKFAIRVGTSSTESIASDSEATTLFDNIDDMLNILEDTTPNDRAVSGTSDSESESLYTWIAWPKACGEITNIRLGAVDSLIDFDNSDSATVQDPIEFDVTNQYGEVIPYYFYRSDSTGAVGSSQSITLFFD